MKSICTETPKQRQIGVIELSSNGYYNNPDYYSEEYAGISPNGDNDFDILRVSVYPQRTMADCNIRIENSSGEVVKRTENPNTGFDKFMINREDFDMNGLPDGDYTVYVTGHLAYEGAKDEEISMRFYIDTVAPQIIKKEIRKEVDKDKTYLDISMSDNRYVTGAVAKGKNADGTEFKTKIYTKAGKTGECSIDITGADVSTLKVTAIDYAYNKTECDVIDAPTPSPSPTPSISPAPKTGDRVEFKQIDNVVSAKLIFEETTSPSEKDIWLIVAYKDNGELARVETPSITDMTTSFVIPEKYKDCEISVYVWDNNMKMLMGVQKADI